MSGLIDLFAKTKSFIREPKKALAVKKVQVEV